MVIGPLDVDGLMEATPPLAHVIGHVWKKVGRRSIALDHDAILLVSVLGGAKPYCPIEIVDLSRFSEGSRRGFHLAVLIQGRLQEVDIEMKAEIRKIPVLFLTKHAHRRFPHDVQRFLAQRVLDETIPVLFRQVRRDFTDVIPLVPPFGNLGVLPEVLLIPGPNALGKAVDLGSGIVVIELPAPRPFL